MEEKTKVCRKCGRELPLSEFTKNRHSKDGYHGLMRLGFNRPLRVITLCSGYDSQCMALERLKKAFPGFDYELVAWSEIDRNAIQAHDAIFPQWAERNIGDMTKMDWSQVDGDIDKIQAAGISKSQQYKMAGNSIVVAVLYHIFRKMFIDTGSDNEELELF